MNSKQILEKIHKENISFIDFWFVDIFGELHCMGMPSYALSENDFDNGLEKLDASSIVGFSSVNKSDMILKPDPSTFHILPPDYDSDRKNARMFCDIFEGNVAEETRFNRDSRGIVSKAKRKIEEFGLTHTMWAQRLNFLFLMQSTSILLHMVQLTLTAVQDTPLNQKNPHGQREMPVPQ